MHIKWKAYKNENKNLWHFAHWNNRNPCAAACTPSLTCFHWGPLFSSLLLVLLGPFRTLALRAGFLPSGVFAVGPGPASQVGHVAVRVNSGVCGGQRRFKMGDGHPSSLASIQTDRWKLLQLSLKVIGTRQPKSEWHAYLTVLFCASYNPVQLILWKKVWKLNNGGAPYIRKHPLERKIWK